MNPTPKQTALRLVLWCALLGWAAWKIRTSKEAVTAADAAPTSAERVLARPAGDAAPIGAESSLGMIDPEALQRGLVRAAGEARACGVRDAVLTVTVGPGGLSRAALRGDVADSAADCLARAVWALAWPAGTGEMEAETAL